MFPWPLEMSSLVLVFLYESWSVIPLSSWVTFLSGDEALWPQTFLDLITQCQAEEPEKIYGCLFLMEESANCPLIWYSIT